MLVLKGCSDAVPSGKSHLQHDTPLLQLVVLNYMFLHALGV